MYLIDLRQSLFHRILCFHLHSNQCTPLHSSPLKVAHHRIGSLVLNIELLGAVEILSDKGLDVLTKHLHRS